MNMFEIVNLVIMSYISSYGEKIHSKNWVDINIAMMGMNVDRVLKLIDVILALPPTSVFNETAFSQLKLIKTERRHRLGNNRLNNLMTIRLDGPGIEDFNPRKAIDKWQVGYRIGY